MAKLLEGDVAVLAGGGVFAVLAGGGVVLLRGGDVVVLDGVAIPLFLLADLVIGADWVFKGELAVIPPPEESDLGDDKCL